jgi:hypothetical protein
MRQLIIMLPVAFLAAGCGVIPGTRSRGPVGPTGDYEALLRPAVSDEFEGYHAVEIVLPTNDAGEGVTQATAQTVQSSLVAALGGMTQVTSALPVRNYERKTPASSTLVMVGRLVEKVSLSDGGTRLSLRVRCLDKATGRLMLEALLHGTAPKDSDAALAAGVSEGAVQMMKRLADWE